MSVVDSSIVLMARSGRVRDVVIHGLVALFCVMNSTSGWAGVMSLPGQFSVGQMGGAAYSIPIALPPSTAGMAPSLSLDYSSQGGNGILGVGWSLGGLPSIGRCQRTVAQDGVLGGVNYDANDRFCMEGQRLILVGGTYGADGAEYRTEIETYSKIISHGSAGNGPAWFEVRTKSGQIMEFGHTSDSQILAQGTATARVWAVNKVSDTKSNYFTVTYANDSATGQSVPSWINYTGNSTTGAAAYNSVAFVYASRPDTIQQYQAGSLMQTAVRLTNVKTFSGAALVSNYQLTYQQSPSGNASEISSIAVCVPSGGCLPATTFQWANGGGTSFSGQAQTLPEDDSSPGALGWSIVLSSVSPVATPVSADLNGDGKNDFLLLYGNSIHAFLANGNGTFTTINSSAPNGWQFPAYNYQWASVAGDFNGDGKTEFVMLGGAYTYTFISNGNGQFSGVASPCPNGWDFGSQINDGFMPVSGDFNSDGRADFLMLSGQYLYVFISNGDGTFSGNTTQISTGWNFGTTPSSNFTAVSGDFNGDGKSDFVVVGGSYLYEFLGNGDGSFSYNTIAIPNGWNFGNPPSSNFIPVVGDFNGDGKTDWLMVQGQYLYEFQSRGDGSFNYLTIQMSNGWTFSANPGSLFTSFGGDFNLDGKADFALIGGGSPYIYQFVSNGDGQFSYRTLGVPNGWNFGAPPSKFYWMQFGDFNGDGRAEFAMLNGANLYTVTVDGGAGDVITGITGGLGATTAISYLPLTNPTVYTKDANAAYPLQDMQVPFYVVSRVDNSNGVGGTYSSSYTYVGARSDLSGRGLLGFRQMTVNDLQTGISDTTSYRQDFPYIGLVSAKARTRGSQVLGQSTNSFQFSNASGTMAVSPSSAPYRVLLGQNVSSGADLDGSALPTVTTTNQYDVYGNATQVLVSTSDGFSKTTVNTYTNDTSLWYLGRLTRATVTSQRPQ
ncbi:FG-GAP-like repeat-containing protein [Bradyrhizobium sp. SZCCHNRI1003]|uniref:FG-GAP-like repeat-containing protein n=1 Tax=Bradyrhizobium sp. SZCCHNRI1003 TaxID=3057275 RepID=UPI0029168162|nr:FG-GAP-like repeat-containing protein [Bradyrhizobium sp. SZCCHNRI1003]